VLDFGLAKALDSFAPSEALSGDIGSPTYSTAGTAPGIILGTVAYMAPEQARGHPVDKRTDIWAFGVVLYEMLSGRRPFVGQTVSDTVAAVLREDVDWTRLPGETPDDLRRLLCRCLERDPKNRLHDAADARLVIADLQREHAEPSLRRRASSARTWFRAGALAVAAAIVGALIGGSLFTRTSGTAPPQPVVRFAIEPPPEVTNISNVTLASDGRFLVYEGQVDGESRLFLREFDASESRPLAGTEGARSPFIHPTAHGSGSFAMPNFTRSRPAAATRSRSATYGAVQARPGMSMGASSSRGRGYRACRACPEMAERLHPSRILIRPNAR
jgi:eukaryotic-like serine/threonine-protein kinase